MPGLSDATQTGEGVDMIDDEKFAGIKEAIDEVNKAQEVDEEEEVGEEASAEPENGTQVQTVDGEDALIVKAQPQLIKASPLPYDDVMKRVRSLTEALRADKVTEKNARNARKETQDHLTAAITMAIAAWERERQLSLPIPEADAPPQE
jgi:hypothetical protein